jgi:katanin p60 ATPase-containing subunit A1
MHDLVQGEHEASRRMKTELLVQMDGLARSTALVFVLTATNLPWELDQAVLRRLEKRIFVGLPCLEARKRMLHALLGDRITGGSTTKVAGQHETHGTPNGDAASPGSFALLDGIADHLEGYSGSDIATFAKEAAMRPVRRLLNRMVCNTRTSCDVSEESAAADSLEAVSAADLEGALAAVKATASMHTSKYETFTQQFGSNP